MNKEENKEKLKNNKIELEYQIEQLQKIIEKLDEQLLEVMNAKESLEDIKNLSDNEEALFPIQNGIFVKGKILDNKKIFLNVGSNVVAEKDIVYAIDLMKKQYDEIQNYKHELIKQLEILINDLN